MRLIWFECCRELRCVINALGEKLSLITSGTTVTPRTFQNTKIMQERSHVVTFVLSFENMSLQEQRSSKCTETKYENAHTYFNFTALKDAGSSDHSIQLHAALYTGLQLQM
jgi:hypothetical protein